MEGVIIDSVSSEATGHPAEHCVSPLEPNFAWEADGSDDQHTIIVDLGESRTCDGFSFVHHELELDFGGAIIAVDVLLEKSNDGSNYDGVTLAPNSDGTQTPNDLVNLNMQLKLRHFVDGTTPIRCTARYWRFTIRSPVTPFFAPDNARVSMLWLFNIHQIDLGSNFPVDDQIVYPDKTAQLPHGKVYRTGHNINHHTVFTRTWTAPQAEYDILRGVITACNGQYRPFILVEADGVRRLCKFRTDQIKEEILDVGLNRLTLNLVEIPVVKKDKYH
jgi:hypothetical protein